MSDISLEHFINNDLTDSDGVKKNLRVSIRRADPIKKYYASGDTNENTVWEPAAGNKFVITDLIVSATAAGTCTLRDGAGGTTIALFSFAANGGVSANFQTPLVSATADNHLTIQASAATQYITVLGYEQ